MWLLVSTSSLLEFIEIFSVISRSPLSVNVNKVDQKTYFVQFLIKSL